MIDLGTQPLGHTISSADLDADRLDYLVDVLDVVELPVVLDVFPRYDNAAERSAALQRGRDGLDADGLLPGGRVHPDLEAWLRILEQPDWYVSGRGIVRPVDENTSITRVCLATSTIGSVVARRSGGSPLVVRSAAADQPAHLLDALGCGQGLDFQGVLSRTEISAPTDLLSEALDASPFDVNATAARLAHTGIEQDAARNLAAAMSTCSSHAEITSVKNGTGTRRASHHLVAFFDTHRGRILATSSTASDGRRWSTLSSGTDGRVKSALAELVEWSGR
ncbi:ESX secretion-associated protein EspG [Rhodococcus sp. G-MC3]|uniref:ESX secretion-associated protein EspG n=1 Tax=Rhodococcus sp. G-MC3 TaxID=3046209 RepID=UPI0024B93C32|nr:ESX secretion-associated protein EspG [Rhodococcus sp. G-MC3]MDJ0394337.1 ESX secretion-associated protein EspG [Rhodococcus sp. G-MC3]